MLSILAIFKNEAHILADWIDSHAAEGVDHFILVNNNSTDDYRAAIAQSHHADRVSILQDERPYAQASIYNTAYSEVIAGTGTEWLLVCDLDEFIYARGDHRTIPSFLATLPEDIAAVSIPWKMFGSSSHDRHPQGPVYANFLHRDDYKPSQAIGPGMPTSGQICSKCIVRTSALFTVGVPYHFLINGRTVDPCGQEMPADTPFKPINEDLLARHQLHLNHYVVQSREYFERVKMARGDAANAARDSVRNWDCFARFDVNHILDRELAMKRAGQSIPAEN
jgi:glycosyltransferase involved in cell wall biosynthesis